MEVQSNFSNKGEENWLNTVSNWSWLPPRFRLFACSVVAYGFTILYTINGSNKNQEERLDQLIKSLPNTPDRTKVAIVTGANSGIGFETARVLAKAGFKVIIACRDRSRAEKAIIEIQKSVNFNCDIEFLELDLNSLDSVRQFSKKFMEKDLPLDLLINNAGIMVIPKFQLTEDNFEAQYQVNYLSHYLLTRLMVTKLKATPDSKIVNLTSFFHYGAGNCDFSKINEKDSYTPYNNYALSKAAIVMSSCSFQERLSSSGVQVFAVHPGIVATELFRHMPLRYSLSISLIPYLTKTPFQGALTTLRVALMPSDAFKYSKSRYFADEVPMMPLLATRDAEKREALWRITCDQLNLDYEL